MSFLVFTDLTLEHASILLNCHTVSECVPILCASLQLEQNDEKVIVVTDMFYYIIKFCQENNFSAEKTSIMFSLFKRIHSQCISSARDNLSAVYTNFQANLLRHSVHRPPFSEGVFTYSDSDRIIKYARETYFRCFKLYKYMFTSNLKLDVGFTYIENVEDENKSETILSDDILEEDYSVPTANDNVS